MKDRIRIQAAAILVCVAALLLACQIGTPQAWQGPHPVHRTRRPDRPQRKKRDREAYRASVRLEDSIVPSDLHCRQRRSAH